MPDSKTPQEDQPLALFAQCHVGIVSQLTQFGRLPELVAAARQARTIANETLKFFKEVVFEHHAEEERELFPAVLASANKGEEHDRVQSIVDQLTQEHRVVESAFQRLESGLKAVAKGQEVDLDGDAVSALVTQYEAHAHFEETVFLPLSQEILGRNSDHLAALGVSIHMRHTLPELLANRGYRI